MENYTVTELPVFTCPKCGIGSQIDDYSDMDRGDIIECPVCGYEAKILERWDTITIRVVDPD